MNTSRTPTMRAVRLSLFTPRFQALGLRFRPFRANIVHIIRNRPFISTHLLSVLAGGGVVLAGGYLWFELSGIKPAIETAISISKNAANSQTQIQSQVKIPVQSQNIPPNEALVYIRSAVKVYLAGQGIPGASWAVDSLFDSIEELHKTHHEEIDLIIHDTYVDVKKSVDEHGYMNKEAALAIFGALRKHVRELGHVAGDISLDALSPILGRQPKLRGAVGDHGKDGSESKQAGHDATDKVIETISSKGVNDEADDISDIMSATEFDNMVKVTPRAQQTLDLAPDSQPLPQVAQTQIKCIQEVTIETNQEALKTSEGKLEDDEQLVNEPY